MALLFIGEAHRPSGLASGPADANPEPAVAPPEDAAEPGRSCPTATFGSGQRIASDLSLSPMLNSDILGGDYYTLGPADAMAVSLAFSREVFVECAEHLVVAEVAELNQLALAAHLAAVKGGPLLVNAPAPVPADPAVPGPASPAPVDPAASADPAVPAVPADPAAPADPIAPEVLAEFVRLAPASATVIGSAETAQSLLDIYLQDGVERPDVTLIEALGDAYVASAIDCYLVRESANSGEAEDSSAPTCEEPTESWADGRVVLPRRVGRATPVKLRQAIVSNALLSTTTLAASSDQNTVITLDPLSDPAVLDPEGQLADTFGSAASSPASNSAPIPSPIWLVASDQPTIAILAQPALAAIGGDLLYVDPDDLRATPSASLDILRPTENLSATQTAVTAQTPQRAWHLIGPMPADADWQLEVIANSEQLPGGGYLLFPDRRIVAMYGHINTASLGVLGEQSPEAGVERARQIAQGYDADGLPVITAFEIITTLASSAPGDDNSYSLRTPAEELRPWVELAAEEDMYVILDLQPGRVDFLTQAKEYEELLKLPHVGLALDPEWRLKPNQRHLRQVGTVDSSEINQVIDWLADLVRENHLPQKLMMVHQFSFAMITNRDDIKTPNELAVMIHMDGQGLTATKYDTYAQLTAGTQGNGWWWGWKNFYDEDYRRSKNSPGPLRPDEVLRVRPIPLLVSFQ